jgi:hypothetical protein
LIGKLFHLNDNKKQNIDSQQLSEKGNEDEEIKDNEDD